MNPERYWGGPVIFGRRKNKSTEEQDDELVKDSETSIEDETDQDSPDNADDTDQDSADTDADDITDDDDSEADESDDDDNEHEEPKDEWELFDESQDWREEGPFDITEVDLDADEIERLDFGCLVLTPFDGMQLQLQVNQNTQEVQAILVLSGQSVMELSLFAAPSHSTTLADVRAEMIANAQKAGGSATPTKGPFGTEVRRVVPIKTKQGQHGYHVSRTWFAHGPRWLLRGVLMGEAGVSEGIEGSAEIFYEFFANTVVRRGNKPMVPGDLIPMTLPESLKQNQQG